MNGKRGPIEVLTLDKDHENTSVMGHRTLFEGSGIHQSYTGIHETHEMYIKVYFMLLIDHTSEQGATEGHGNIRIELLFSKTLPESITCLLYLQYESTVRVNLSRIHDQFFKQNGHMADSVYAA